MIKTIIFDFDDTLYCGSKWTTWVEYIFLGFYKSGVSKEDCKKLYEKYGVETFLEQLKIVDLCFAENINTKKFRNYLKKNVYQHPFEVTKTISNDFLKKLSKKYKLYVLSLSEQRYIKYYGKKYGVNLKTFKKIITLNPIDRTKAVEMKKILQKEKLLPEECLMIGDSLKSDIQSAESLGIKTYHFNRDYDALYKYFETNNL